MSYPPGAGLVSGGVTAMVVVIVLLTYLTVVGCDLKYAASPPAIAIKANALMITCKKRNLSFPLVM